MLKRFIYSIVFASLWLCPLLALDTNVNNQVNWDKSEIEYRHPSAQKMDAYKKMDVYIYDRYVAPETWWDKVKRWLISLLREGSFESYLLKYIYWGLLAVLVLVVVLKLLGVKPTGLFNLRRDKSIAPLSFKQANDDIYSKDLDGMLKACVRNKAYREAVRLLYLVCLRNLDKNEWIAWKPWKTNKDYYYELKHKNHQQAFKNLVFNFEYVWYGQFNVDVSNFETIKEKFEAFSEIVIPQTKK